MSRTTVFGRLPGSVHFLNERISRLQKGDEGVTSPENSPAAVCSRGNIVAARLARTGLEMRPGLARRGAKPASFVQGDAKGR
jgi:hypothetical protein